MYLTKLAGIPQKVNILRTLPDQRNIINLGYGTYYPRFSATLYTGWHIWTVKTYLWFGFGKLFQLVGHYCSYLLPYCQYTIAEPNQGEALTMHMYHPVRTCSPTAFWAPTMRHVYYILCAFSCKNPPFRWVGRRGAPVLIISTRRFLLLSLRSQRTVEWPIQYHTDGRMRSCPATLLIYTTTPPLPSLF